MASQASRSTSTPGSAGSPTRRRRSTGALRPLALRSGEHAVDVGLMLLECLDDRRVLRVAELVVLHLTSEPRACRLRSCNSLRRPRAPLQGVVARKSVGWGQGVAV